MADFKTHVTFSSIIGGGYAVAGSVAGLDLSTALVAGGLCGVSGMLPDVDSDSGVPRREAMGFAAAIVPMLLLDRFDQLQLGRDQIILVGSLLYFFIRFTAADLIGKFSVHRGMWHSIPAVFIFAGIAFLMAGPADNLSVRYFKAFAVGLGALSHLVLDEIYSVDTRGVMPKFKKSFGTAVKMWGKKGWANFSTYAKLALVALCIMAEPQVLRGLQASNPQLAGGVQAAHNTLQGWGDRIQHRFDQVVGQTQAAPAPGSGWANNPPQQANPWRGFAQQPGPTGYAQQTQAGYGQPPFQQTQSQQTQSQQTQSQQTQFQQPPFQQPPFQQPQSQQPQSQQPQSQQPQSQQPQFQQPAYNQPAYAAPGYQQHQQPATSNGAGFAPNGGVPQTGGLPNRTAPNYLPR